MSTHEEGQRPKTREELVEEARQNEAYRRRKAHILNEIWPFLLEKCETIEDAQVMLETFDAVLRRQMVNIAMELPFTDLKIEKFISTVPEAEKYRRLFTTVFEKENIGDSLTMIGQMKEGVSNYVQQKVTSAPLKEVDINKLLDKHGYQESPQ